ncbi:pilus assembly protein TadG-related protein [Hydrocarboniphaga sp.]|uniref:pilus assembly protein TadG-related protein n=1 Tax=Hydrocarboniphaga sp. TaxID=2033016 RepID=UPI003D0D0EAB
MGGRKQGKTRGTAYQRGAVAIWVGVSIVAMMTATFLAIETGRLYFAQRDLQRMANLAAVAGVQAASGCAGANSNGTLGSLDDITTLVQNFIVANGGEVNTLVGINGYDPVELGHMVSQGELRVFSPLPAGDRNITSVRVNLRKARPTPFSGFLTGGGDLIASATAEQPAIASFRLGTTLLNLDQGALNTLLSGLLGANVSLTLLDYQSLLRSTVSLQSLMLSAGVTDLSQLLAVQTDLPGALQIVGDALALGSNSASAAAAGLLTGLAGTANPGAASTPFAAALGNLGASLNPAVTDALAAVPLIDGLGLLTALGQSAANGGTINVPVSIPGIPGLVSSGVFLEIKQPEQLASGPAGVDESGQPLTSATSSQVVLKVRLNTSLGDLAKILLGIDVRVANGYSRLLSIDCPGLGQPYASADIATTTSTLTATLGTFKNKDASVNPPQDLISGDAVSVAFKLVTVNVTANQSPQTIGTTVTQTATGPFPEPEALPTINSTGNLTSILTSLAMSNMKVVIGIAPFAYTLPVDSLLALLTPIFQVLDAVVLDPLLSALGVGIGESGVTVTSITVPQAQKVSICVPGGPIGAGERGCP